MPHSILHEEIIPIGHTTLHVLRLSIFSGQGLEILNHLKHFSSPRRGTSTVLTVVNRLFVCTLACRSNIELLAAGIVSFASNHGLRLSTSVIQNAKYRNLPDTCPMASRSCQFLCAKAYEIIFSLKQNSQIKRSFAYIKRELQFITLCVNCE